MAAALSQGFMCVEMVTDLACAETVHHLFDPGCLPRPLLWPSHSLSANRSVWHPSCVVYVCIRPCVWLADGRLCRLPAAQRSCYGERFVASGSGLKDISAVHQKLIPGFLQFSQTVALHCPSLCPVPHADRGHGGNVILVCWR